MKDFADIAAPLLRRLEDNPDLDWLDPPPTTSSPFDASDMEDLPVPDRIEPGVVDDRPRAVRATEADVAAGTSVMRVAGLDVLAFYKSFRFRDLMPYPGQWGIFVIEQGVATIAAEFQDIAPDLPAHEAERLAFQTLLEHERFHFWVDAWTLSMEDTPLVSSLKKYETYVRFMRDYKLTKFDYEESLANNYSFNKTKISRVDCKKSTTRILHEMFSQLPIPYCNYNPPKTHGPIPTPVDTHLIKSRLQMEHNLAGALISGYNTFGYFFLAEDRHAQYFGKTMASMFRPRSDRYPLSEPELCPVYTINDTRFAARVQPFQGPQLREFKKFVEKYLAGVPVRRTDHEYFRIDNGEEIKFPNPHDLNVRSYELSNVLATAGMIYPEFVRERQTTKAWSKGCPRAKPKPPRR